MTADEIAFGMLDRLLSGDREEECLPLNLGMLLERVSPLRSGEQFYRDILPASLAEVHISPEAAQRIQSALCDALRRDPTCGVLVVIGRSLTAEALRSISLLLIAPPRPLTSEEEHLAFNIVCRWLPVWANDYPELLSSPEFDLLVQETCRLRCLGEAGGTNATQRSIAHSLKESSTWLIEWMIESKERLELTDRYPELAGQPSQRRPQKRSDG